jgi:transcriptional regulator with XRE-family HTH domain
VEPSDIGSRVRAARERCGWSREALAFHAGMSWSAIAQIESGRRRNMRPGTLVGIADALGVTIDYLVRGSAPASPMLEHRALIYDSDQTFVTLVAQFLEEGAERGEALLVVTSRAKIARLRRNLGPTAKSIQFTDSADWYTTAGEALDRAREFVNERLEGGAPWVRMVGEPVWEGRSKAEIDRWKRYESLINLVFPASAVSILCPYDSRTLDSKIVESSHVTHPQTAGADGPVNNSAYADPGTYVLDARTPRGA